MHVIILIDVGGGCVCSASACIIFPYLAMRVIDKWGVHYDVKGLCVLMALCLLLCLLLYKYYCSFPPAFPSRFLGVFSGVFSFSVVNSSQGKITFAAVSFNRIV